MTHVTGLITLVLYLIKLSGGGSDLEGLIHRKTYSRFIKLRFGAIRLAVSGVKWLNEGYISFGDYADHVKVNICLRHYETVMGSMILGLLLYIRMVYNKKVIYHFIILPDKIDHTSAKAQKLTTLEKELKDLGQLATHVTSVKTLYLKTKIEYFFIFQKNRIQRVWKGRAYLPI